MNNQIKSYLIVDTLSKCVLDFTNTREDARAVKRDEVAQAVNWDNLDYTTATKRFKILNLATNKFVR